MHPLSPLTIELYAYEAHAIRMLDCHVAQDPALLTLSATVYLKFTVPPEYLDFLNIFLKIELPNYPLIFYKTLRLNLN
jgi:hypothetical protein